MIEPFINDVLMTPRPARTIHRQKRMEELQDKF